MTSSIRLLSCLFMVAALCLVAGCRESDSTTPDGTSTTAIPVFEDVDDDALREMIDDALHFTYTERQLTLDDNAAWQILHGALPFGMQFKVYNGDVPVPAMRWVLDGNQMNGWTLRHGAKGLPGDRRGLKLVLEPGTKTGQGHEDQWLAVMSQCGLPRDEPIVFQGQEYQLWDVIQQAMWDTYKDKECSWTLIALTKYLDDFDTEWKSSDGKTWTVAKMIEMEAEQDLALSACGGTHRLIGLTMALDGYRERGGKVDGGWLTAQEKIESAIAEARRFQQPEDGSFSTNYFSRPGTSADLALRINTSGHTLEFLTLALDPEQLSEPWMENAVKHLCEMFKKAEPLDQECGSLYHAAHGLIEYRERRFGPWPYPDAGAVESVPATTSGAESPEQPDDAADASDEDGIAGGATETLHVVDGT